MGSNYNICRPCNIQKFRLFCERAIKGKQTNQKQDITVVKLSPGMEVTAEMLKEEHPQFEEANFILLEIKEVNIFIGLKDVRQAMPCTKSQIRQ